MVKKKNNDSLFKRIIIVILLLFNIITAFLLLGAFINHFIPPIGRTYLAFLGLIFPYLMIANCIFVGLWLFLNYRYCVISMVILLMNINNIDSHYQLKDLSQPSRCINCVKVMSYNAQVFGLFNSDDENVQQAHRQEIMNMIRQERPDILCLQEYVVVNHKKMNFSTTEPILEAMEIEGRKRSHFIHINATHGNDYQFGMAIFSRYSIINTGVVEMAGSVTNGAIYADIRFKNDTIRVYCGHLSSMHLDKEDYQIGKSVMNTQLSDPKMSRNVRMILSKISKTFKNRRFQAEALRADMDSCKIPVIVCGDFNDTPASYAYYKISKNMKDCFRESGKGRGETYHSEAFPNYRIDYILHDKRYNDYECLVNKKITVSDHYPITAVISLQKKIVENRK